MNVTNSLPTIESIFIKLNFTKKDYSYFYKIAIIL
jgi:hypothetical protein